jgi:hypothetical protein
MSNIFVITESIITKEKKSVDRQVGPLLRELSNENTLLPETPLRIVQRLVRLWQGGGKVVFAVVSRLPLIPNNWRMVINAIASALDAAAQPEVIGEIAGKFKAGKDL